MQRASVPDRRMDPNPNMGKQTPVRAFFLRKVLLVLSYFMGAGTGFSGRRYLYGEEKGEKGGSEGHSSGISNHRDKDRDPLSELRDPVEARSGILQKLRMPCQRTGTKGKRNSGQRESVSTVQTADLEMTEI